MNIKLKPKRCACGDSYPVTATVNEKGIRYECRECDNTTEIELSAADRHNLDCDDRNDWVWAFGEDRDGRPEIRKWHRSKSN